MKNLVTNLKSDINFINNVVKFILELFLILNEYIFNLFFIILYFLNYIYR